MAHFAKLGIGNAVQKVEVVSNDIATTEQAGVDFLNNHYKTTDVWKQTSYNTRGGVHYINETDTPSEDQSKALRKNYAGLNHYYNEGKDAFIEYQPYPSWTLNETSCKWEAPVAYPDDGANYIWDEATTNWVVKSEE
jgi:hypothetical protein